MATFLGDLRLGFRALVRQRSATALIVPMLALGTGAAMAVFLLINALFLRPLPFPDADRLVSLDETAPAYGIEYAGVSYADFLVWRANSRSFEAIGAYFADDFSLTEPGSPERIEGAYVTADLTAALGVEPVAGRGFTPEEEGPASPAVALIGHGLWQRRFGGSAEVVGTTVRIDGVPRTVVGILPQTTDVLGSSDLWLPIPYDSAGAVRRYTGGAVGRLRAGVSIEEAGAELMAAHGPIWEERDPDRAVLPTIVPLQERLVGDLRPIAIALAGTVALVLLIACANVASILLARSFGRRREMALRMALGARSGRIARQLMAESFALAIIATPFGAAGGLWAARAIADAVPEDLPPWLDPVLDWRAGLFGLGLVAATVAVFGAAPVVQARRTGLRSAISDGDGRSSGSRRQHRGLQTIVVAEVALAAALLVGAGLLLKSLQRLGDVDPGFRVENVLSFRVALPDGDYPPGEARFAFYRELLERIEAVPGVVAAGGITCPPLDCFRGRLYEAEGVPAPAVDVENPVSLFQATSPGYFDAMGIRLVAGRFLDAGDMGPGAASAVVIDEHFARQHFPDVENPVGRRIRQIADAPTPWYTVVGVAGDVMHEGFDRVSRPTIYFPLETEPLAALAVAVRTAVPPTTVLPAVREIVRDLDPRLPLFRATTMEEAVDRSLGLRRAYSALISGFAALALALAVGGIYGVTGYLIEKRRREYGIRIALGASTRRLRTAIIRQGAGVAVIGVGLGLLLALFGSRLISGLAVGVSTGDPGTYMIVAAVLIVTAALASLGPARRLERADPAAVLTDDG